MPRTTADLVKGIIEVDSDSIPDLLPFINTANELVTEVCASVLEDDDVTPYYSDVRLELIERWLAAHFYAVRDPRPSSETAGDVGAGHQYRVDLNLQVTTYGQQALMLDTQGGLLALSEGKKRAKVGVHWLGMENPLNEGSNL